MKFLPANAPCTAPTPKKKSRPIPSFMSLKRLSIDRAAAQNYRVAKKIPFASAIFKGTCLARGTKKSTPRRHISAASRYRKWIKSELSILAGQNLRRIQSAVTGLSPV
jgi:hypothetical protein